MADSKMILAIETVHDRCSVCVFTDGKVLASQSEHALRKQTQMILPMIDDLLSAQGITSADISAIAFNRGPGSFSGIRINTAVAQGLAFAHDIPCVPVSGLAAQAQAVFDEYADITQVTIINDAKMKEVYLATFSRAEHGLAQLVGDEQLLPLDAELTDIEFISGDGVALVSLPDGVNVIESVSMTAEHLAKLAWQDVENGFTVPAKDAQPVYLRNKAWKTLTEQAQARAEKRSSPTATLKSHKP